MRGHTSEVLDIKHLTRRWGCLETQQRVRMKCWHMIDGSTDLGTAHPPQPQAPRTSTRKSGLREPRGEVSGTKGSGFAVAPAFRADFERT